MSFSNLDYLYEHLPARMRRDDEGLFLKRLLSVPCEELDNFDAIFDGFHRMIAPETATEAFIDWWLWAVFGWGWFPDWVTLPMKRQFYADVARHYARRGTARGIVEFLAAFGIKARVINQPQFWGEMTVGDDTWTMTGPLVIVVQIFPHTAALAEDLSFYGEWTTGESVTADPALAIQPTDVEALLRFQQPVGHTIIIEEKVAA
jgi:phage tail-like protein